MAIAALLATLVCAASTPIATALVEAPREDLILEDTDGDREPVQPEEYGRCSLRVLA